MRYNEIVAMSSYRQHSDVARSTNQSKVKQIAPHVIEGTINRLYDDLMDALDARLLNVVPVHTRDKR